MPKVAFYTLGCKLNQYETEAMRQQLEQGGYGCVDFDQPADIYVVNTCTVTHRSDVRSRQMIRRAARRPGKHLVVVTGCYAQRAGQKLSDIPGVDLVLGNLEKTRLLEYIVKQGQSGVFVSRLDEMNDFPEMEVSGFAHHTRAFLKIQDGCDGSCTYCVVPKARGRSRSRSFPSLAAAADRFIQAGYRELVLTGINLGAYRDPQQSERDLVYLLKWLEKKRGLGRVRLSSIEPTDFSAELIDLLDRSPKICRHVHIPLQSGDDEILRAMGRPYRAADYAHLVMELAKRIPGIAIGADVIVGFPGETEGQFQATGRFIENLPICRLHVFNYSRREGTPAATIPHQVPAEVRRRRSRVLRALSADKFSAFQRSFLNHQLTVLLEQRRDPGTGLLTGLSENYIRVLLKGSDQQMNQLVPLRVYRVDEKGVWGRCLNSA